MEELHQSLHQQLGGLEAERNQIAEATLEIQRQIGTLDAVMSWTPIEKCEEEIPQESRIPDVSAETALIGA